MSDFTVKTPGFAGLNRVLGNTRPHIPYCWNGNDVIIKTGKFNQQKYLDGKIITLRNRKTILSLDEMKTTFERVVAQNSNVLFEMEACTFEQLQQLDAKFNLLLEAAFTHAENEHSLKLSKENIKNSMLTSDSWMDINEVNKLMKLVSTNPADATNPNKFVPKHRR